MFIRTIHEADLEGTVVGVVGVSPVVASHWHTPLAFLFIDGGHGVEPARTDYECWTPKVTVGGTLAIHDVFPDPADGGRPPYEQIYLPALESGHFEEIGATGSLPRASPRLTPVPLKGGAVRRRVREARLVERSEQEPIEAKRRAATRIRRVA